MSQDQQSHDRLGALILKMVKAAVEERVGRVVTSDGRLALGNAPTQGMLGTKGGGTGTTWGFKDHDHSGGSSGQTLDEANTHGALDTDPATMIHWTREQIQDMLATGFIVAGTGVTLDYNDATGQLTINAVVVAETRWEPLTQGDPDYPELIFENGDVLMEEVPL